jgi:Domain of unknown function (DUF4351)
MPSHQHEVLLLLFHNRPELAAELLREVLHVDPPPYARARIGSAELSEIDPVQYQADLVVILEDEAPVLGIVVEVQLAPDRDKRFVWPVYATNLRARLKCPVCLLVVAADDGVARWAAKPIELGGGNQFVPFVLGPSGVPEVTDPALACADPELAVLSAMAHGQGADVGKAVRIALVAEAASNRLDENRHRLYSDLIWASLSEAARKELQMFDPAKLEFDYQSWPASRWFSDGIEKGRTEGETAGRAALVCRLLAVRFGPLTAEVEARVRSASIAELDAIGERLLAAPSLEEALGQH